MTKAAHFPVSRRVFLGGGAAVLGGGLIHACGIEPRWLDVTVHEHRVAGLPSTMDRLSIAQVSDAHLKQLGSVERAVREALEVHDVQVLALTGDLVDTPERLSLLREFCANVARTGMATVATLGNWEHWAKISHEDLTKTYTSTGVRLLVNETVALEGLQIVATDDSTAGRVRLNHLNPDRGRPLLLLTHSPELLDRLPAELGPVALSIAGHTHGGQVRMGSSVVPFVPGGSGRFVSGWYETPVGPAYVSRGTGTSIAPVRFTCRPELPIFRLLRA